jgi:sugar phosphate isomerase/epimerase
MPLVGLEWRRGSRAVRGRTEGVQLTACAYTIAGALVGAGVGEPSPWGFEVRVAAAADAGYKAIGLFESDYSAMIAAGADDDELREILDRHGLVVAEIEFFFDWAHDDELASRSSAIRESLIHMAEAFRPHHISLGEVRGPHELPPLDVVAERFGRVSDRVAPYGVDALLEFLPWSGIPDVATSAAVVERAGRDNGGIYLDVWHYFRGSSSLDQLAAIDPHRVRAISLSDAAAPRGDPVEDTTRRRLLPGHGEFDIVGLLIALREMGIEASTGVEILSEQQAAMGPTEAARASFDAAVQVLALAGYA